MPPLSVPSSASAVEAFLGAACLDYERWNPGRLAEARRLLARDELAQLLRRHGARA